MAKRRGTRLRAPGSDSFPQPGRSNPPWYQQIINQRNAGLARVLQQRQAGQVDQYGIPYGPPAQRLDAIRRAMRTMQPNSPQYKAYQQEAWKATLAGVKAGTVTQTGQIVGKPGAAGTPGADPGPPKGTYDPALDAALGAATRGYGDLVQDVGRQARYGLSDFLLKRDDLLRERREGLADLLLGQGRAQQDLKTGLSNLSLQYARLGNKQAQTAQAMGVARGGALQQAFNKRLANHLRDVQPLQQSYNRFTQDTTTKAQRLWQGVDRGIAAAGLDLQRAGEGWTNQLTRGQRELTQFGIDTNAQKYFAAGQGGWVPPAQGGGQTFNRHGLTYQVTGASGPANRRRYQYGGNVYNRNQWLAFLRGRGIR